MANPKENSMKRTEKFSKANHGTYNITNHCYPENVSTSPDMQHYVTFFINVRGKSKVFKDKKPNPDTEITSKGENRTDSRYVDNGAAAKMGVVVGAGAIVKSGMAGRVANQRALNNGDSIIKAGGKGIAARIGAGAVTGLAAAGLAKLLISPDTTYRISDCITLHVNQSPSVRYGAEYAEMELGALAGMMAGGSSAADMTMQTVPEAAKALFIASAGKLGNIGRAAEVASKQTLNPYREVLFKQIGFRQFAFDYKFMPKNAAETKAVFEIIKTFKFHMHPELSSGALYYIHPSEFNIQYYFKGEENKFYNKISTCVLEKMHVDYGGNEGMTSFKDGSPVEIGLRLEFMEIESLTKDSIEAGF